MITSALTPRVSCCPASYFLPPPVSCEFPMDLFHAQVITSSIIPILASKTSLCIIDSLGFLTMGIMLNVTMMPLIHMSDIVS